MFTIDLLKGRGVPIKSGPEGIAVTAVTFTVPVIIAIVMFGSYLYRRVDISVKRQAITNYEAQIEKLSDALHMQQSFEQEKMVINNNLSEVSSFIGRYIQWSPILLTLVENMPDAMVLTKLEVKKTSVKRKMPNKNNPKEMIDTNVPQTTLHAVVSASSTSNSRKEIRDFRDRLRHSAVLSSKLETIKVSQESDKLGGHDAVSYKIDCVFKPIL